MITSWTVSGMPSTACVPPPSITARVTSSMKNGFPSVFREIVARSDSGSAAPPVAACASAIASDSDRIGRRTCV